MAATAVPSAQITAGDILATLVHDEDFADIVITFSDGERTLDPIAFHGAVVGPQSQMMAHLVSNGPSGADDRVCRAPSTLSHALMLDAVPTMKQVLYSSHATTVDFTMLLPLAALAKKFEAERVMNVVMSQLPLAPPAVLPRLLRDCVDLGEKSLPEGAYDLVMEAARTHLGQLSEDTFTMIASVEDQHASSMAMLDKLAHEGNAGMLNRLVSHLVATSPQFLTASTDATFCESRAKLVDCVSISSSNVWGLLVLASSTNDSNLKAKCRDFIVANLEYISRPTEEHAKHIDFNIVVAALEDSDLHVASADTSLEFLLCFLPHHDAAMDVILRNVDFGSLSADGDEALLAACPSKEDVLEAMMKDVINVKKGSYVARRAYCRGCLDCSCRNAMGACLGKKEMEALQEAAESAAGGELSVEKIAEALMEALRSGVEVAVESASAAGGFNGNPAIRIPWPEEAKIVDEKLRSLPGSPLDEKLDDFVDKLNEAAEEAAKGAKDIFMAAVDGLNIETAKEILGGAPDAATAFLKETCFGSLKETFTPVVEAALEESPCTDLFEDLISNFNDIPFVDDIDFDLSDYAVARCIQGLFELIKEKEQDIRDNPAGQASELLNDVFSQASSFAA